MKEDYLNSSAFENSVNDLVKDLIGRHYRPKPWKLHPGKAALLVLDMQNYFLDPASHAFTPSAPAILPNVKKLILMAHKCNMDIIFTRHVNDDTNAGMMGRWWRDLIVEGSFEAQISQTVGREEWKRRQGDRETRGPEVGKIITKNQYDAFYNTELEEFLRLKNVEQVIISGLLANLCCETTARSAFVRGFEVFFPIDATAAYNRDFHLSTLRNLGFGFCPLIRTSELISSVYED
jgi:nicotinamidase-related amidase